MESNHFADALIFLIATAFSLYILAVMLRFLLQTARADFFNPISQFLVRATSPVLNPLRRIIPGVGGIDLAAIVLMFVLQLAALYIIFLLAYGQQPPLGPLAIETVGRLLGLLLNLYTILILIGVIVSWVNPTASHPGLHLLHQLVSPILRPIRSFLPDMGGLDLSPLIALVLIHVVRMLTVYPLRGQVPLPM
ncbi:YggT family protein [Halorhodospira halophila]|uniref:YggT family protein n=1 Tax=Halorhodospira halophila (strain DSM 244 / SL1) TaxID=349124 RepID=A1WVL1_HALHL|nr:YggT family protein [Halorhodospira halophila]ABM61723.1 protein of unknown function YGGT [Halorhodospira halophila SL1]MBK1728947.1 YggT family protein [Halorhodospira halophila]